MISGQQDYFFLATWWAGYFFPSQMLCKIFFFSPHFSAGFFFPPKSVVFTFTECIYIYIVVIAVTVLIWSCKKTDDVFSLWNVNRKDIDLFIEQANTIYPTIKFRTAEISEKEITFLDTVMYKSERFLKEAILDVKTHYKLAETFQYTEYWGGSRI